MNHTSHDISSTFEYKVLRHYLLVALELNGINGELDKIHLSGKGSELSNCLKLAHQSMERSCVRLTKCILNHIGLRGLVWIAPTLNLRFITPKSFIKSSDKALSWQFCGHPVHIDSIYNVAINNKNLWIPFTDIHEDNSLILHHKKDDERLVGKAGLAHLFDSDIPHETVVESEDRTRITLTLRFCTSKPMFRQKNVIKYKLCLV